MALRGGLDLGWENVQPGRRDDPARRATADCRSPTSPQLLTALPLTGRLRTIVTAGHRRRLSPPASDILQQPKRGVPDARRALSGHRDQRGQRHEPQRVRRMEHSRGSPTPRTRTRSPPTGTSPWITARWRRSSYSTATARLCGCTARPAPPSSAAPHWRCR